MRLGLLAALGAVLGLAAPSLATAGPGLVVGAVEDDVRASTLVEAETRMTNLRVAGFRAVRITSLWTPGTTTPSLSDEARTEFASYAAAIVRGAPSLRHIIVANEPNLNRFWLPQFALDGSNAAAPAYLALLAHTYDALKTAAR